MKHIGILAALAVVCLLAVPAFSAADGTGAMGAQNGKAINANNGQCNGNCQCSGPCGEGAAAGQGQFGLNNGACQGAGTCDQVRDRGRDGSCDGTGPVRDRTCQAAA